MILRDLYLYPSQLDFGTSTCYRFKLRTRSLCNFLGRRIACENFKGAFGRICVIGARHPRDDCLVNSCNVVSVEIPFTQSDYDRGLEDGPNEHFIALLEKGLAKLSAQHEIPLSAFGDGIEEFRKADYRNEWVWKRKRPRGLGLAISFDCNLTMERFTLHMRVYRKSHLLLDDLVLETVPDELIFVPAFKKLEVAGSVISVLPRVGEPTYRRDLSDLLQ